MPTFLVVLRNIHSGEGTLLKLNAKDIDSASNLALESLPDWQIELVKFTHGGSRPGSGRVSKWGDGVVTSRFRLPEKFGQNAEQIIDALEGIDVIIDAWEGKVTDSKSRSNDGYPAERYKYVAQLILELRSQLIDLPKSYL